MTKELRDKEISTGQVLLRPCETFNYYSSVFFIGTFNIMALYSGWNQTLRFDNPSPALLTNRQLLFFTGIVFIVMTKIYYSLTRRLKLRKVETELTAEQIRLIIYQVGQRLPLRLNEVYADYFEADYINFICICKVSFIIDDKDFYVNCRRTDGRVGGFSRQEKLMKNFIDALEKANDEIINKRENLYKPASR